jgi:hypothetical protein
MNTKRFRWLLSGLLAVMAPAAMNLDAASLTINLVDSKTGAAVTGIPYRWLVQLDTTYNHIPGKPAVAGEDLSVSFHKSYAPVVGAGDTAGAAANATNPYLDPSRDNPLPTLDPAQRYFVSVMPSAIDADTPPAYNMGGAPAVLGTDGTFTATVALSPLPVPTAQISVLVFEDKHPINNEPEVPEENGLAGFSLQILDTGGTLGITGGPISNDAFGHKLGTTYVLDQNGNPDMSCDGPCVLAEGSGVITTDASGQALVKYLPPGRWSVIAIPPDMPPGQEWHQTSTLEGKKDIEAFTKANEPPIFVEFGPPGYHVFIGFIQQFNAIPPAAETVTVTGRITNNHTSRPPEYSFYSGLPMKKAWVGLNDLAGGAAGEGIYAAPCDPETGEFSIPGVPVGSSYQLVTWDDNVDNVFAFYDASVPAGTSGTYDLGDVPVFSWFSNVDFDFFYDTNGNGARDPGEPGMPGQSVNLRWRDGSIYDSNLTNDAGHVSFHEVFPFFNWIVTEFDFSRWGTTGVTMHVDAGGPIDASDPDSMGGLLNPQEQPTITNPVTGNNKSRTETISPIDGSLIATEAFQVFLGQDVYFEYGKHLWGDTNPATAGVMNGLTNGGIAGGVWYDSTRAEDDPRNAGAETWQPGIPRVQMYLYNEDPRATYDDTLVPPGPNPTYHGKIADTNGNGSTDLADVDNWPFGWADGGSMGPEDVKRNGDLTCNSTRDTTCAFDLGDAIQVGGTTSWDDDTPTGCVGPVFYVHGDPGQPTDCFDGLRNFNQARAASNDGFYGFGGVNGPGQNIPPGNYIVEAVPPPGYKTTAEESKNVNFGQSYVPSPLNLLPECVGDLHQVPAQLELFPGVDVLPGYTGMKPLCDRKLVTVAEGQNAAADFFMYTLVPVASNMVGVTTDDTTNEFDPNAPNFGEKYAPPHMPISIQDWTGRELYRTYTDEYGAYNGLVPSSYSANIPVPSGFDPNMLLVCMNHPGPIPDPANPGKMMIDPYFLRQYSQFCYVWSFMPGKTSYLDTPVVPVAAFSGPQQSMLDCELPDGTPKIYSVTGPAGAGPWVSATYSSSNGNKLTIVSEGTAVPVTNPAYDTSHPAGPNPRTINRDYGFGTAPLTGNTTYKVLFGDPSNPDVTIVDHCASASTVNCWETWTPDGIVVRVPNFSGLTAQLTIVRGDTGRSSVSAVTVTKGGTPPKAVPPGGSIQNVIDNLAAPGDLITVPCGNYPELLIMTKPVRLQGWGPGCVTLDATAHPAEKVQLWNQRMQAFMAANPSYVLPGQPTGAGLPEPTLFATEQGPGVIALGPSGAFDSLTNPNVYRQVNGRPNARIDGFTLTGGSNAGSIFVNGYAHYLQITNNHIVGNAGFYNGGVRAGYPSLVQTVGGTDTYVSAFNDNLTIAYNQITENAGLAGAGGGISLCAGADSYKVSRNWICGNYTNGSGGGIGHLGLSSNGVIDHNTVIFNQTFDQSTTPGGGGIYVAGDAAILNAAGTATISPGAGNVTINANLIQGNLAGAGDGGGIRAEYVNGDDVVRSPRNSASGWYRLQMYNNIIANNMAGLSGGAISLQDVVYADIINNTIADNDSSATAGSAFPANDLNQSNPRPAGVVSYKHSAPLIAAFATKTNSLRQNYGVFSSPGPLGAGGSQPTWLANNIIVGSRSLYALIDSTATTTPAPFNLVLAYYGVASDLAVIGTASNDCGAQPCHLHPVYSVLSSLVSPYNAGGDHNVSANYPAPASPMTQSLFQAAYYNGGRSALTPFGFTTDVQMAPAFDEGGNFIDVRFGPLTLNDPTNGNALFGNYSILSTSPAHNTGANLRNSVLNTTLWDTYLAHDYFSNPRPGVTGGNQIDAGAVELQ